MIRPSFIRIVLWIAALALISCGDQAEEPRQIPTPDPGQRFFEGGETEFFGENSTIVTIDPELGYRPDLELHDDVYWLPDEISKRKQFIDASTVEIPLSSEYDPALGYEVGMVIINKYWPIRHRIMHIEKSKSRVTWTVAEAAYDEVIRHGDIYTYLPPDVPTPVAFDVLDPWLYEDRDAQIREIEEKYLDSDLVFVMSDPESLKRAKEQVKRKNAMKAGIQTVQQKQSIPRPGWCDGINDSSLSCDEIYDPMSDDYIACEERKRPCTEIYEDAALIQQCETAKANGDFDAPDLLVCDSFVRNSIDDLTPNGSRSMDAATWDHSHCVDDSRTLTCDEALYVTSRVCRVNDIPLFDELPTIDICPLLSPPPEAPNDQYYDDASSFLCETLCRFEDEDTGGDGGAGGDDWSNGIGVCVNSQVFGDDKCRARLALRLNFDVELSGAELTDGVVPVTITLAPVLTVAVGFKARMRIRAFWAGVTVGFFAGVGFGAQTTVSLDELGYRWEKSYDLFEEANIDKPEIPLPPILFLTFHLQPSAELHLFAEASVLGSITHNYFQERGFVICIAAKAGAGRGKGDWPSTGLTRGDEAARKCGLEPYPETEPLNEITTSDLGVEIRAGLELELGVELVMGIGSVVELGSLIYYPFVPRVSIGATIRPPRCTFDVSIEFGWRLLAELYLKVSKFRIDIWDGDISNTYPRPKYYRTFPLFQGFLGCGEVNAPEPAAYEGNVCPPGPDPDDPDANCLELPQFDGLDSRCFVERCVLQDEMRVSLAWFDARQDLDLYVRDPDGLTYGPNEMERTSCGATCGGTCGEDGDCEESWICEGDACQPEDQTYIENFVGDIGKTGTWEAWVVRRTSPNITEEALAEEVLFDLEFENAETAPDRRATRGSIRPSEDGAPVKFLFCIGEDCQ